MSSTTSKSFDEAMSVGRIRASLDSVLEELERGAKRGLDKRRSLWGQIQLEAQQRLSAIPAAAKPRAPKSAKIVPAQPALGT